MTLRLTIDGVEIGARMRARMVYHAGRRGGGRFVDLTPSQTALLRYLVTWRGQAAVGAIGTATLLDAITRRPSPPDAGAAAPEAAAVAARTPWWSRWFGRLLGPRRAAE